MQINLDFYMNLAIDEAWKYQGLTYPNPAVGSVVVGEKFELLSIEAHKRSGEPHAEVNALRSAFFALTKKSEILELTSSHDIHNYLLKNHNNIFTTCTIFVTLEPCNHVGKTPSCASLLKELNFKKIYIATPDLNAIASNGAQRLQSVEFGVCEKRALELLEPFKIWQQSRFIFFKWAFRLDGTVDGGAISTKNSRTDVHKMRDVCDLLIIGGNTVRVDRPTLDARLVNGKAPDVLIYSRSNNFDKDIALFKISNRKVFIANNFDIIKNYENIMVEGGSGMFNATTHLINYYLSYQNSSTCKECKSIFYDGDIKLKALHVEHNEDIKTWYKRV